ncbi:unnamed protein product [Clonostachys chloroleuca]|uniref:Uncharacterized protein n=1 Tax=Clonostachys chloroleuca TaxID=1926264 RepID=A0AA35Q4Q3_9HYPO|nr:unnamed protein product [Clonostachys chloroleuca]
MSLARAFTTRRVKNSNDPVESVKRSNTLHKASSHSVLRSQISGPVQLVHTTNMLSYNAPDIPRRPSASDSVSTRSEDDYDSATATSTPMSTPPTSPDTDKDSYSPQPNHLSSYFVAPSSHTITSSELPPAIPKRSPSHTKQGSYEAVARKQSVRRTSKESEQSFSTKGSVSFSRPSSISTRASTTSYGSSTHQTKLYAPPPMPSSAPAFDLPIQHPPARSDSIRKHKVVASDSSTHIIPARSDSMRKHKEYRPEPPIQHSSQKSAPSPFGSELAQVSELAEEFGAHCRMDIVYEDDQYLMSRGLARMTADDYLNEIHSLIATFFPEPAAPTPMTTTWI